MEFNRIEKKPKKHWQNLLHKKCPNCDSHLEDARMYLRCPNKNVDDPTRNCFFIKKTTAAEFLLDTGHPANFCLTAHEKETLEDYIKLL